MKEILQKYIPSAAIPKVIHILNQEAIQVIVKRARKTRHGDYRRRRDGSHQITVNASLNPYRFLMTLIHEVAHLEAYKKHGQSIKPHGVEWKRTFQKLMRPFINATVFPETVLPLLENHFQDPKASSDTDVALALAMKAFDPPSDRTYIFEIPNGAVFRVRGGRVFRKQKKRVKRFECIELSTSKVYLVSPHAEVELLDETQLKAIEKKYAVNKT